MLRDYITHLIPFDLFSQKWTLFIVLLLFLSGSSGFNRLKSNVGPITSKVLAERLQWLERSGIVVKTIISEKPKRVEYMLTDTGRSLITRVVRFFTYVDQKHVSEADNSGK